MLGYIKNDSKRLHVFVVNSVQQIREQTSPANGDIETKCNPAQDASHGITAKELVDGSRRITGPEFLWMPKDQWPQPLEDRELVSLPDNPEVKKVTSYATSTQESWACRAIAICLRYKEKLWQLVFPKKERCAKMVKRHQRPALTVKRFVS